MSSPQSDIGDFLDEEDEEDEIVEPQYEMTDWFPFKTKPVHKGFYEVRTVAWPFPHKVEWTGKKWLTENEITDWRGLAKSEEEREYDILQALEELKIEFERLAVRKLAKYRKILNEMSDDTIFVTDNLNSYNIEVNDFLKVLEIDIWITHNEEVKKIVNALCKLKKGGKPLPLFLL